MKDKKILLGISGGIAAYRACEVARLLIKSGARVRAAMTEAATRFVTPLTFQALTGHPVAVSMWDLAAENAMSHIELARWADVILIAPATANTVAKLAHGMADDLLSTLVLASTAPVLAAPSMNSRMYLDEATQANLETLRRRSRYTVIEPESGDLACLEQGPGRLPDPVALVEAVRAALAPRDLEGRSILISGGPTREHLDPVRFLSNASSGKMGFALARAAKRRGASVTLVTGPAAQPDIPGVDTVRVVSAEEMAREIRKHVSAMDAAVLSAAVTDWAPCRTSDRKVKKAEMPHAVELSPSPDIIAEVGKLYRPKVLVGFAAETHDLVDNARAKLLRKNLDFIVANNILEPGSGFGTDTNRATLVFTGESEPLEPMTKDDLADRILDRVAGLLRRATTTM